VIGPSVGRNQAGLTSILARLSPGSHVNIWRWSGAVCCSASVS